MTGLLARHRTAPEPDPGSFRQRPYDLVKEFVISFVVVVALTIGLAAVFSSPDEHAITIAEWAKSAPTDFVATALSELDGTSGTATYGPPYNSASPGQVIGPINLQKLAGVRQPIDTAQDFVLGPLERSAPGPAVRAALQQYRSASVPQEAQWATRYSDALAKAPATDPSKVRPGLYGPLPVLMTTLLTQAKAGAMDGALLSQGQFFATDNTPSLLFIADGTYLEDKAVAGHLGGDQWGMMNETGSYPGQAWLWLYTFWYQVKPFSTSDNADALVWGLMMLLTLGFVFVPFLPGIRSIPRLIPIYRLVWREHYREQREAGTRV